jgi:hypothetical protein
MDSKKRNGQIFLRYDAGIEMLIVSELALRHRLQEFFAPTRIPTGLWNDQRSDW